MEKLELPYTADRNITWYRHVEYSLTVSLDIKHTPTIWSRHSAPRYLSREMKHMSIETFVHKCL